MDRTPHANNAILREWWGNPWGFESPLYPPCSPRWPGRRGRARRPQRVRLLPICGTPVVC